jgi:hypothetical protein
VNTAPPRLTAAQHRRRRIARNVAWGALLFFGVGFTAASCGVGLGLGLSITVAR